MRKELTNKEIKEICINEQKRQTLENYPDYKFKITQTKKEVRIYWEYLDGEYWTINKKLLIAKNEHNEIKNEYFDFDNSLIDVVKSCVYYMVTRY